MSGSPGIEALNILLWRQWKPLYTHPATFSCLQDRAIGGTCSQMLWHARNLRVLGHRVQVLGASQSDIYEEEVDFVGAGDKEAQIDAMQTTRIREPDVIFLEGAYDAAKLFRVRYPQAKIVHVGQNIDAIGHRGAFAMEPYVDAFGLVGPGQLADYSVRFPGLRHKFLLLRNVVPWKWLYSHLPPVEPENRIVWIGGWGKRGLRTWAEVMVQVLSEHPDYSWTLFGPSYGIDAPVFPGHVFHGLALDLARVSIRSLPMCRLIKEIQAARVVLVSLGLETASISALDAHAVGRPVLSGNDMVYKYANPEGTGIRLRTRTDCYQALSYLLSRPDLCDRLGQAGRELVLEEYTEDNQIGDLNRLFTYLRVIDDLGPLTTFVAPSRRVERAVAVRDKAYRVLRTLAARRSAKSQGNRDKR